MQINEPIFGKQAGLDIITWTLERSGLLKEGGGWYYQTITSDTNNDGDVCQSPPFRAGCNTSWRWACTQSQLPCF